METETETIETTATQINGSSFTIEYFDCDPCFVARLQWIGKTGLAQVKRAQGLIYYSLPIVNGRLVQYVHAMIDPVEVQKHTTIKG